MCNTYFLTRGDPSPAGHIVWQEFKKNSPPVSEFEYCLANVIPDFAKQIVGTPVGSRELQMLFAKQHLRWHAR
jgi:hypothetical protein